MRETLYIRLRSGDPGAATSYCIASPTAVASFAVAEAPLESVLREAGNRRLIVLVPGSDVRLTSVTVPARQSAKVLQAAPYALEDQLAEDVETLHFALGPRQGAGQWPVAVVSQSRMAAWLEPFLSRDLKPDALIPETLSLPAVEPERWSALAEPDQVSVRTGPYAGFACLPDDLPLFLSLADPDKRATLRIILPRDYAPDFTQLGWPVELFPGFAAPLEALLQNLKLDAAINLLQGRYSQREDLRRLWTPWRVPAALAGGWLVLAAALHGIEAFRLDRELKAQQAHNIERYQQLFPAEARIVDLGAQLDQQLAALRGGGAGGGMLPLVEVLSTALRETPGLTVRALRFREGALEADLTGSDLQLLESLRAWFGNRRVAAFDVLAANSGAEGVQIRVKLKPVA